MEIEYEDDESRDNDQLDQTRGREAFNENGAVFELQNESHSEDEEKDKDLSAPFTNNLL